MAYIDKTRSDEYMQKKAICLAVAELNTVAGDSRGIGVVSGNFLLFKLPCDSILLNAFVHVVEASDAATSAVATLGTTEGGTEILSAADLTSTGMEGTFTGQSLTGTGVDVYFGTTITGAATAGVGSFIAVIEYLEFDKNTGEYTEVTRAFA